MMTRTRTTRRPRRCARDCGVPIRAGQQAEHIAIPPGGMGGLSGDSWTHMVCHAEACPDPEQLPAEELAAALAEMDAWLDGQLALLSDEVAALGRAVAEVTR